MLDSTKVAQLFLLLVLVYIYIAFSFKGRGALPVLILLCNHIFYVHVYYWIRVALKILCELSVKLPFMSMSVLSPNPAAMAAYKSILIWHHESFWNLENCFSCRDNTDVNLEGQKEVKYESPAMTLTSDAFLCRRQQSRPSGQC